MKDLRTALLLSNNNAVLKSFVSQDLQPRMGVSNFIVVGQDVDNNPVHDFIVGFTTLLYMDNHLCRRGIKLSSPMELSCASKLIGIHSNFRN